MTTVTGVQEVRKCQWFRQQDEQKEGHVQADTAIAMLCKLETVKPHESIRHFSLPVKLLPVIINIQRLK